MLFPPRPSLAALTVCLFIGILSVVYGADAGKSPEVPVSEEYVLRTWDVSEGLPNNHISCIAQTPDGFLWTATWWGGLARFDGVRFTVVPTELTPEGGAACVNTLFTSHDGTLWVGLERGGLARRVKDHFEPVYPLAPLGSSTDLTSTITEDAAGAIWFAPNPDRKLFRWTQGKIDCFAAREGVAWDNPYVHVDASRQVWFSARAGCAIFDGNHFRIIDRGPLGGRLAPARGGGMWALGETQLLKYHADGRKEAILELPWHDSGAVAVAYTDRAGDLWIGTRSRGLFRFRDGELVKVPTSHSSILSIFEDREGNLWVGTEGGLNRLRPTAFSLRQTRHGLRHDSIVSLCEDTEERLWLAGRDGAPVRALDSTNRAFKIPPAWESGAIMTMLPASTGGVWLGLLGELVRWKDNTISGTGLFEATTALLEDGKGLWASTIKGGLVYWHNDVFEKIPTSGGLIHPRALAVDGSGRVWAGTQEGRVFLRKNGQFVPVPLPNSKPGEAIRFIVRDQDDTVWIAAYQGGLYQWKNGKITHLTSDAGLPTRDLRSLIIEPNGDFWFGAGQGLFRVPRSEIEAVIHGKKSSMHSIAYGRNEGVPSVEFSFGFRNATAQTHDGHLWFATYSGALEITPERLTKPVQPVPVLIEEIQIGGVDLSAGAGEVTLPPHAGPVRFNYTLPQLSTPEQITFRYRLQEGGEGGWMDAGAQRTASFGRLSAGSYRFEVMAANAAGQWLPQTASLNFTVRAAWWETSWFRFGSGAIAAVGLGFLVRFIVKRRMQARITRLEQAHALERERTRIARDMHDHVGACLTQIAFQAELAAKPEGAAELAETARRAVAALDSVVWAVNPKKDTLASLLQYLVRFAEEFLNSSEIRCRIDFPTEVPDRHLPPEFRHHIFLVVKEAVNNAVKYSNATEVRLSASFSNVGLTVGIADNGNGFTAGEPTGGGNGLGNMRERAADLGGECRVESQSGSGVSVTLIVPWPAI